ncbi:MAG: hypothetical protein O7G84_00855 [Gammaproteobacteria bacterium]|nr:hypothetical protein [Gammaproteobacteria bacterium]
MTKNIRIYAPEGMDRLELAQHVMGPSFLLKAERLKYSERTFQHYKAMQQSAEQFERAYRKQMARILQAVRAYAEEEIIDSKLKKAERSPYDSIANPEHLKAIRAIVTDYHLAFIAARVGPEYVSAEDIQRIIDSGILPADLQHTYDPALGGEPATSAQSIADAYNYGISMGRDPRLRGVASVLGIDPWRTKYGDPTLSSQEQAARTWASGNAANTITGLGNRVGDDFSTLAVEADAELRAKYQADVRQELDMNIERQQSWRKLASDLGHRTEDWSRDFKRIAATEKQAAMQQGLTAGLIEREGDPDEINVAKQPSPGACPDCVRLHYTAGEGSPLRIFKLSELQANGTNVGKKQNAWLATIGPIHPWCHRPDAVVETREGPRPLALIRPGDRVLTHKGRFRPVQRVAKRAHRGELVELLSGDEIFVATPEHPYLTQRGWVAASDLQPGDHLMRVLQRPLEDVGANDNPAERFEVGRLLEILGDFAFGRVPRWVHLYGRENPRQREVDVVWAYRQLRRRIKSVAAQGAEHLLFILRQVAGFLSRLSRADLLHGWARLATDCGMSVVYHRPAALSIQLIPEQASSFSRSSDSDAIRPQLGVDRLGTNPISISEFGSRSASNIGSAHIFNRDGSSPALADFDARGGAASTDGIPADPKPGSECGHSDFSALQGVAEFLNIDGVDHGDTLYHGVEINEIRSHEHDGEVYSLSVAEDESYIVDGVVVHNCACELIHVPNGWGFNEDGDLMPESLLRAELLPGDLRKAHLTWGSVVPERGVAVRLGDPQKVAVADEVIARTPPEIFDRRVGITLICEDEPRVENAMSDHDLAYWTGNEIRVSGKVTAEMLRHVLEHEIGHSLNVWLMYCWGGEPKVIAWHAKLYQVSEGEGFVSAYAQTAPIENAAELTRLYLYDRKLIMMQFPRAFAMLHKAYKGIWRKGRNDRPLEERPGEQAKQRQDAIDERKRGGARL